MGFIAQWQMVMTTIAPIAPIALSLQRKIFFFMIMRPHQSAHKQRIEKTPDTFNLVLAPRCLQMKTA
jgi:hypothetical protein